MGNTIGQVSHGGLVMEKGYTGNTIGQVSHGGLVMEH